MIHRNKMSRRQGWHPSDPDMMLDDLDAWVERSFYRAERAASFRPEAYRKRSKKRRELEEH